MTLASLQNPRQVGTLYRDAVAPVIAENVLDEILSFSGRDLAHERGGFLIGQPVEGSPPLVVIRHFHPALEARGQATSLTFTHDSWASARRQVEERFQGEQIVGWQHTHPGMGVFLSHYDRFIQQHFFSQAWQVALVVDPRQQEFGFFHWRQGEIRDCGFLCTDCG